MESRGHGKPTCARFGEIEEDSWRVKELECGGGGHVSLPRDGVPQQEVDPFSTVSARWDGGSDHILLDSPKDDMIT